MGTNPHVRNADLQPSSHGPEIKKCTLVSQVKNSCSNTIKCAIVLLVYSPAARRVPVQP